MARRGTGNHGSARGSLAAAALMIVLALSACGAAPEEKATLIGAGEPVAQGIGPAEVQRLRALGYVDEVSPENDAEIGVLTHDPHRVQPGLTYYTDVRSCSSHLMDAHGNEVRSWRHVPCRKWDNTVLLPNGEVLAVHYEPPANDSAEATAKSRKLVKLGWDGELLWSKRLPVHHDVELSSDGRISTLTYRHRLIPAIHSTVPVRDHFVTLLSPSGELLEEASLTQLLLASPKIFQFQHIEPKRRDGIEEIDLLHSNSVEWMRDPALAERNALYAATNVLVCLRNQDAIVVIDWQARKAVWAWGQGELSGPHDATLLPSGNLLVFDNGIERSWSRVLEVDPLENRIVWEYKAPDPASFFTLARGASQRLPNGNTLITDSAHGRLFEVTPNGETVWLFNNPRAEVGRPRSRVVRARRLLESDDPKGSRFTASD